MKWLCMIIMLDVNLNHFQTPTAHGQLPAPSLQATRAIEQASGPETDFDCKFPSSKFLISTL